MNTNVKTSYKKDYFINLYHPKWSYVGLQTYWWMATHAMCWSLRACLV